VQRFQWGFVWEGSAPSTDAQEVTWGQAIEWHQDWLCDGSIRHFHNFFSID